MKFFPSQNGIVYLPPKLPLKLPHDFRQGLVRRLADHEDIHVADSILLIACERPIQNGFLNSLKFC